ncbi:hypothetical protein G6F35_016324 [Rhizopus arrhizus]|nr:hypothetical protein G6F35_016324 [Rhizopus arrhizus]
MVGHSTLRAAVMPDLQREATPDEVQAMQSLADDALASGAIGISTGTFYPPAARATTEEIIEANTSSRRWKKPSASAANWTYPS